MENFKLIHGDCLEALKQLEDNSIDSIVTDPPYGIGFMNKEWDKPSTHRKLIERENKRSEERFKNGSSPVKGGFSKGVQPGLPIGTAKEGRWFQEWCEQWAKECLRVLKPGGYLLSFSAPRTYHRMTTGFEDAGFEIRDQIMWLFGSGFPKSYNIGKGIEGKLMTGNSNTTNFKNLNGEVTETSGGYNKASLESGYRNKEYVKTKIDVDYETEEGKKWEGWGTALKPAHEPICVARKPLSEKTNVENVLRWGTGGLNIDESRIGYQDDKPISRSVKDFKSTGIYSDMNRTEDWEPNNTGRWPANIIFDEEAGKILDEQSGIKQYNKGREEGNYKGGHRKDYVGTDDNPIVNKVDGKFFSDKGGASRFFYCPKTSKKDRDEGITSEESPLRDTKGGSRDYNARCGNCGKKFIGSSNTICSCENPITDNQVFTRKNNHPTVKPTDLMQYLIRMVTPKGGVTLDPFMGSGSSGKAAIRGGFNFIGIEKEEEYINISRSRIEYESNKNRQTSIDFD
jgi:site-specific DNA-methyltransferase (adenine-specific)